MTILADWSSKKGFFLETKGLAAQLSECPTSFSSGFVTSGSGVRFS